MGLNCVIENLLYLQYQLSQLIPGLSNTGGGGPQNMDPVTCTQLTQLVLVINTTLEAIVKAIAKPTAPPDLSGVAAGIAQIAVAAQSYPPLWKALSDQLNASLGNIASAIANAPPPDLTALVGELAKIFKTLDVPLTVYEQLASDGWISPETLQMVGAGEFGTGIINTFRDYVSAFLKWVINGFTNGFTGAFAPAIKWENKISRYLESGVDFSINAASVPLYPLIHGGIQGVVDQLKPITPISIGDAGVNEDLIVAKTLAPALLLNAAAFIAAYYGWNTSEQLRSFVDIATEVIGLNELREFTIGAMMEHGPAAEAQLQAKKTFRQDLPGYSTLAGWAAQGLLTPARLTALAGFTGIPAELEAIANAGAYRGLNARQLLRLIETDLFTLDEIHDELTFSGMRPASQGRMLRAAPYLATASERSSLRSTLESAYVAGLLTDADLQTQVVDIEANTDLGSLVLSRARLQKLIAETKAAETEYSAMFVGGLIDDATYRGFLQGLGLVPDMVNTIAARAEARANVTTQRKNLAEAAREARAAQKAIDQAAIKNFMDGNIDAATLLAALTASGIPVTQAAAMTDLAALRLAGSLRWTYGLDLSPAQATVLRARVTALSDQRKKLEITDDFYIGQLQALGIPPKWVNALRAIADASITPKSAAFAVPVQTG